MILPPLTKGSSNQIATQSSNLRVLPPLTSIKTTTTPKKTVTPTKSPIKATPTLKPKPLIAQPVKPTNILKSAWDTFTSIREAAAKNIDSKLGKKKNEEYGATLGRALQKVPNADLGTKYKKTFKPTKTEEQLVNFVSNFPSAIAQGYGQSLQSLSTKEGKKKLKEDAKNLPKTINQVKIHIERKEWQKALETAMSNSAFTVGLDVSSFIPEGFILKGLGKGITGVKGARTTAREIVEAAVKEDLSKAGSTGLAEKYVQKFGNVVDSDRAKELLPGYKPEKAAEFHKPSQAVRDEVYTKLLNENKGKGDNTVYFTAGGAASGKSESLVRASTKGHSIIYDTTLSSPERVADLRKAIDNGFDVHVDFTASDPIAAWDRVQKRGRQIPLESFVRDYEQSLENVKSLYKEFKDNPDVNFGFIDNRGEMGKNKVVTFDEINKINYNKEDLLKEINAKQNGQKATSSANNQRSSRSPESGNEAQVSPKKVSVPREQLPVKSQGVERVSRLEARVTQSLDKTPQEIKDQLGSTFNQMNKAEQKQKAIKYVLDNPEEAMAVLRGEKEAPKDLLKNSIYVAMENLGKDDVDIARKLASLQSTRAGQELSILTEIDKNSPVKLMRDVVEVREKAFKEKYGGRSIKEVSDKVVTDIQKRIKKPDRYDWSKFVDSIAC